METAIVRAFRNADLSGAAAALVQVHSTDGYPVEGIGDPESWVKSDNVEHAWVAESEGRIVGHVAVMRPCGEAAVRLWTQQSGEDSAHVAVLGRLFVVRAARKQATGRRLVEAAMSYALTHRYRMVLDVMEKDTSAIRLYERLGWRKIGETSHTYGASEIIPAACYVSPDS